MGDTALYGSKVSIGVAHWELQESIDLMGGHRACGKGFDKEVGQRLWHQELAARGGSCPPGQAQLRSGFLQLRGVRCRLKAR